MSRAKPFEIPKRTVWEAFKRVRANRGAAGVDKQSSADFERDLSDNLYKLWNRLSSGSYFPPPVRRVEIPKSDGGKRPLGIPTVADRVAQAVVKMYLEPLVEPHFHVDSYGYRPEKSALQAVGVARQRCFVYHWVLDVDIKGFFDHIEHELLMRAVRKHTDCKWVLLYIDRWLKAPAQLEDGTLIPREEGTPQGGVISPLLANIFLHYAFDLWMRRNYPSIPFERYADDVICHCRSEQQAQELQRSIGQRLAECGLELNVQKTKVVFCKTTRRPGSYPSESFDFLGYTFRPRKANSCWGPFIGFSPAISNLARKSMQREIRTWRLARRTDRTLEDLARMVNPILRGWINYYGHYSKSALYPFLARFNLRLEKWARRKYTGLSSKRAKRWMARVARRQPGLFMHWALVPPSAG